MNEEIKQIEKMPSAIPLNDQPKSNGEREYDVVLSKSDVLKVQLESNKYIIAEYSYDGVLSDSLDVPTLSEALHKGVQHGDVIALCRLLSSLVRQTPDYQREFAAFINENCALKAAILISIVDQLMPEIPLWGNILLCLFNQGIIPNIIYPDTKEELLTVIQRRVYYSIYEVMLYALSEFMTHTVISSVEATLVGALPKCVLDLNDRAPTNGDPATNDYWKKRYQTDFGYPPPNIHNFSNFYETRYQITQRVLRQLDKIRKIIFASTYGLYVVLSNELGYISADLYNYVEVSEDTLRFALAINLRHCPNNEVVKLLTSRLAPSCLRHELKRAIPMYRSSPLAIAEEITNTEIQRIFHQRLASFQRVEWFVRVSETISICHLVSTMNENEIVLLNALNLSKNRITTDGAIRIAKLLMSNLSIVELNLLDNDYNERVGPEFLIMLRRNIALQRCEINDIDHHVVTEMNKELDYNSALDYVQYHKVYQSVLFKIRACAFPADHDIYADLPEALKDYFIQAQRILYFLNTDVGKKVVMKADNVKGLITKHVETLCDHLTRFYSEQAKVTQSAAAAAAVTINHAVTTSVEVFSGDDALFRLMALRDELLTSEIPANARTIVRQRMSLFRASGMQFFVDSDNMCNVIEAEIASFFVTLINGIAENNAHIADRELNVLLGSFLKNLLSEYKYNNTVNTELRDHIRRDWTFKVSELQLNLILFIIDILGANEYSAVSRESLAILKTIISPDVVLALEKENKDEKSSGWLYKVLRASLAREITQKMGLYRIAVGGGYAGALPLKNDEPNHRGCVIS